MWVLRVHMLYWYYSHNTWELITTRCYIIHYQYRFKGASSFNQNLCSWKNRFPYFYNSVDIFTNSGCTYEASPDPGNPNGGPFCASECADVTTGDGTAQPTLPSGSSILLACGSTAGNCANDPTRVADPIENQVDGVNIPVRCCVESSTRPSGWSQHSRCADAGFTSTWGKSSFSGVGCVHSATYDEAETYCSNAGGRLCTAAELLADCTRGSGCGHDFDYLWSSTPAGTASTGSLVSSYCERSPAVISRIHKHSLFLSLFCSHHSHLTANVESKPVASKSNGGANIESYGWGKHFFCACIYGLSHLFVSILSYLHIKLIHLYQSLNH